MKRYEMIIQRASGKEYKYMRAVQISSLVGLAEDMLDSSQENDFKVLGSLTLKLLSSSKIKY